MFPLTPVVRVPPITWVRGFSVDVIDAVALDAIVPDTIPDIVPVGIELPSKSDGNVTVPSASPPVIRLSVPVSVTISCDDS
jgi:hypothetical protein